MSLVPIGPKLIQVTSQTFVKKKCTGALKQHIFNKCGSDPRKALGTAGKFLPFSKDSNAIEAENYLTWKIASIIRLKAITGMLIMLI